MRKPYSPALPSNLSGKLSKPFVLMTKSLQKNLTSYASNSANALPTAANSNYPHQSKLISQPLFLKISKGHLMYVPSKPQLPNPISISARSSSGSMNTMNVLANG